MPPGGDGGLHLHANEDESMHLLPISRWRINAARWDAEAKAISFIVPGHQYRLQKAASVTVSISLSVSAQPPRCRIGNQAATA